MPPKNHGGQYEDDNKYDDPIDQRQAPGHFYGWCFRRHRCQTRSKLEVVDNYSESWWDKTTLGSWRRSAYRPRPRQRSMSPRQGGWKAEEMNSEESLAEYLNEKQRGEVTLEKNQRPSEVAAVVEAAWKAFIHNIKPPFLQKRRTTKKASGEKSPCWP